MHYFSRARKTNIALSSPDNSGLSSLVIGPPSVFRSVCLHQISTEA